MNKSKDLISIPAAKVIETYFKGLFYLLKIEVDQINTSSSKMLKLVERRFLLELQYDKLSLSKLKDEEVFFIILSIVKEVQDTIVSEYLSKISDYQRSLIDLNLGERMKKLKMDLSSV